MTIFALIFVPLILFILMLTFGWHASTADAALDAAVPFLGLFLLALPFIIIFASKL